MKLDGRTRKARILKAKKERKEIFSRLKPCKVEIDEFTFDDAINGATIYYFLKSQGSYMEFLGVTERGLLNHIRHTYTNYDDYLDILRELKLIPFSYRLSLGIGTEEKAYSWIKRKFNRKVKKECQEVFDKFNKWRESFEKKVIK